MHIKMFVMVASILLCGTVHAATVATRITVVNQSHVPISCQALTGHWYSFDLGSTRPAQRLAFSMDWEAASGVVSMKSPIQQDIPLQVIYCGYAGQAWETRAGIPLRHLARLAAQSGQATLVCTTGPRHLECKAGHLKAPLSVAH